MTNFINLIILSNASFLDVELNLILIFYSVASSIDLHSFSTFFNYFIMYFKYFSLFFLYSFFNTDISCVIVYYTPCLLFIFSLVWLIYQFKLSVLWLGCTKWAHSEQHNFLRILHSFSWHTTSYLHSLLFSWGNGLGLI